MEPDHLPVVVDPVCSAVGVLASPHWEVQEVRSFTSRHGQIAVLRCSPATGIETACAELSGFEYDEFEHALVFHFVAICGACPGANLRVGLDERRSRLLLQSLLGSGYLVFEDGVGGSVTLWYDPLLPFTLGGRIAEALRQHRSWLVGRPPVV